MEGRLLLEFCDQLELCVANTWFKRVDSRRETYRGGSSATEIDFVIVGQSSRKVLKNVKVIQGVLQQSVVVADIDRMPTNKVIVRRRVVKRRVWKLKNETVQERFEKRVSELMDESTTREVWTKFRDGLLKASDEICGKTKGRRKEGNTWWWNGEVKQAIRDKKTAFNGY